MAFDSSVSRREALRVLSATALALVSTRLARAAAVMTPSAPSAAPNSATTLATSLTPELTEGPYFIDLERIRRDITEGKLGLPLKLRTKVVHAGTGASIPFAAVDIWHCDAQGVYSGFSGHMGPPPGDGHRPPPGPPGAKMGKDAPFPPPGRGGFPPGGGHGHPQTPKPDNQLTFLRGVQLTDARGLAEVDTIYPGWYTGRTTHIHVRVHTGGLASDGRYRKGHVCHTGQIFFPEEITRQVYALPAYARKEEGRMIPQEDGIFRQGGSRTSRLTPIDPAQPQAGYFCDTLLVVEPTGNPSVT